MQTYIETLFFRKYDSFLESDVDGHCAQLAFSKRFCTQLVPASGKDADHVREGKV